MSNSRMIQEQIKTFELFQCLLALLFICCIWLLTKRLFSAGKNKKLPPSPWKLPIIGNLHQVWHLPHRSLASLSKKYGPVMYLQLGSKPALVISSAAVAKEVVKTHDISISDILAPTAAKKLFYGGKSLIFSPYGQHWKQLRSIFVNHLLHKGMIKSFESVRDEVTLSLVEKVDELSSTSAPVNLTVMFKLMANDMICKSAFGKYLESTGQGRNKILGLIDEVVEWMLRFSVGDIIPWLAWMDRWSGFDSSLEKLSKKRDRFLGPLIQKYLETPGGDSNFLDILIGLYKGNTPGISVDRRILQAIIQDVHGAGTDTTSVTLEWIMTELMRHPNIMKKLQDEVREVMNGKQNITGSELEKMQYLKAVVKETLRLHPPIPIRHRQTNGDVQLMGYDIPAGTMITFNLSAICQDPTCWIRPETFLPERFLNSSKDYKGLNFEFIPFGVGRRICPGMYFATSFIEHVLATLMHKFDWQLPNGARGEDLDVIEKPSFIVGRKNPLIVVPTKHCF